MPPAYAAAAAASKKKQAKRRAKLEAKTAANEAQLDVWFARYDTDNSGNFDRAQMANLLTEVKRDALNDIEAVVRDELLDKIISQYDLSNDKKIERTEVLRAVKKYKFLLKHEMEMKELFTKHDTDSSGFLSAEQLTNLLKEIAAGLPKQFVVSECDVAFVMERCDADADGKLGIDELGPAIATWKEAAKEVQPEAESSFCVLL